MARKTDETEERKRDKARAIARYLRISPRKMRLVIDTIRRKPAGQAFAILRMQKRKAARMAEKLLKSAVANAKVLGLKEDRLYISDIRADSGPTFKRFMARSMGRADRILKRTTHLSIVLEERQGGGEALPDVGGEAEETKDESKVGKVKSLLKRRQKAMAAADAK